MSKCSGTCFGRASAPPIPSPLEARLKNDNRSKQQEVMDKIGDVAPWIAKT